MEGYGINDALVDLEELDSMDSKERSEAVARLRELLMQLQQASVLMDDDSW